MLVARMMSELLQIGDLLGDIGRSDEEKVWYEDVRRAYLSGNNG